jgi:uncharacterized protein YdaU (DUF1376 family)
MAKVDIWMPIYIGDYLRDTVALTDAEHGAYLLLLMHYWLKNGEIGSDIEWLAKAARTDPVTARYILGNYFTLVDGNYKNKRADIEIEKALIRRASASENGKRGGKPSHHNPKDTDGLPAGIDPVTGRIPDFNPDESSSSSSSSSKNNTRKKEEEAPQAAMIALRKKSEKAVAKSDPLYQAIFQSFIAKAGAFSNYPKEAQAIKRIIKYCEAHAPVYALGDKVALAEKVVTKYFELTQNGEKFWRGQPFTPSSLSCSGIFDRVLVEIGQSQEDGEKDGIPFQA